MTPPTLATRPVSIPPAARGGLRTDAPALTMDPPPAAALLDRAGRVVPPLWPLKHFVAVNPYLGLLDRDFSDAAHGLAETAGARGTAPRSFLVQAMDEGRIQDRHLAEALARATRRRREHAAPDAPHHHPLPTDAEGLKAAARSGGGHTPRVRIPTVAGALGEAHGRRWDPFVTERISSWASAYFDEGQAPWGSPWSHLRPYAAWHAEARVDRTPEAAGIRAFRSVVAGLPSTAPEAAAHALEQLKVPPEGLEAYLQRLAWSMGGWAAFARYRVWEREVRGEEDDTLVELLAIRLAWEVALLEAFAPQGSRRSWEEARSGLARRTQLPARDGELEIDLVLQEAFELAWQEEMVRALSDGGAPDVGGREGRQEPFRPDVQAAFCIDVRSEVFRRALESVDSRVETLGFAGFFGFSLDYLPLGADTGTARCPVLLTPSVTITEGVDGRAGAHTARAGGLRILRRRAANAWKSFKMGAVSCFAFVGPVGLAFARKLATDGLGLSRTVPHPGGDGIGRGTRGRLAPTLDPGATATGRVGMTAEQRLETAESVLRAMSLTGGLAPLVILAGHGSTTVNNPHATGLDCGACGGHTGETNARVAAAVLNDPAVRAGLAGRGIDIPADTLFVAALHDTTTDEVVLFRHGAPASHGEALDRLERYLAEAGRRARRERAPLLGVPAEGPVDARILERSRDWSQVRPEWGLAGCAAFVAAPRHRTAGVSLGGRAFLHSYHWREDRDFSVLELILTAPVVVASWISLQYYGSTVDNRVFGSGNKALHNVVGALGVLEGNGGDLRGGLPWQSVHDGERFVHEPLRLNVVVEAPREAMNAVIARHADLRRLVDNGWVHLWAMDEAGAVAFRYEGGLSWSPVRLPAAADGREAGGTAAA